MKRSAKKSHMSTDRLSAGQTGDRLIDNSLENGSGKILFGGAIVDQRLDIRFGKDSAAGSDGVQCAVVFCIFIQAYGVRLQKRSHLVDKRSGSAGADTVHTLFDVSAFKIDDLGVLAAQLDGDIRLGSDLAAGRWRRRSPPGQRGLPDGWPESGRRSL